MEPDHLGSGLWQCQARGQITAAATLTPANGVASDSKSQVQGADTKVRHRLGSFRLHKGHQQRGLTPREASSWPDATAWLPVVPCGQPAGLLSTGVCLLVPLTARGRPSTGSLGTWLARVKQGRQTMVRDPRAGSGVRRSLEQTARGGGNCKAPWAKS